MHLWAGAHAARRECERKVLPPRPEPARQAGAPLSEEEGGGGKGTHVLGSRCTQHHTLTPQPQPRSLKNTNMPLKLSIPDKARQTYLTQCVDQFVSESQIPHKTVNLMFQFVIVNNKLIILWGS